MAIEYRCGCGNQLSFNDSLAGHRSRCPRCLAVFTIPVPASPAVSGDHVSCPACGKRGRVPHTFRGKVITCKGCGAKFTPPALVAPSAPQTHVPGDLEVIDKRPTDLAPGLAAPLPLPKDCELVPTRQSRNQRGRKAHTPNAPRCTNADVLSCRVHPEKTEPEKRSAPYDRGSMRVQGHP
jgi:hypothetical protein